MMRTLTNTSTIVSPQSTSVTDIPSTNYTLHDKTLEPACRNNYEEIPTMPPMKAIK